MFTADNARRRLANLAGSTEETLEKFIVKKFSSVDLAKQPTLGLVSRMLDIAPFVVVVKTGKIDRYCSLHKRLQNIMLVIVMVNKYNLSK